MVGADVLTVRRAAVWEPLWEILWEPFWEIFLTAMAGERLAWECIAAIPAGGDGELGR
jgi:hypothetical protein